jgi:hypothetical protein
METQLGTLVDSNEEQKLREEVEKLDNRLNVFESSPYTKTKVMFHKRAAKWSWEFTKSNWTFLAFVVSLISIGYVYQEYASVILKTTKGSPIPRTQQSLTRRLAMHY